FGVALAFALVAVGLLFARGRVLGGFLEAVDKSADHAHKKRGLAEIGLLMVMVLKVRDVFLLHGVHQIGHFLERGLEHRLFILAGLSTSRTLSQTEHRGKKKNQ